MKIYFALFLLALSARSFATPDDCQIGQVKVHDAKGGHQCMSDEEYLKYIKSEIQLSKMRIKPSPTKAQTPTDRPNCSIHQVKVYTTNGRYQCMSFEEHERYLRSEIQLSKAQTNPFLTKARIPNNKQDCNIITDLTAYKNCVAKNESRPTAESIPGCEGGELSSDSNSISCPNGNVYRLDSSINQVQRAVIKDVQRSISAPAPKRAGASER